MLRLDVSLIIENTNPVWDLLCTKAEQRDDSKVWVLEAGVHVKRFM